MEVMVHHWLMHAGFGFHGQNGRQCYEAFPASHLSTLSPNGRDANIANGGNPWPVVPHGVLCNDSAGKVIAVGEKVKSLAIGNCVGPIVDTENITGRESTRSWLTADEDGVLADFIVFDERKVSKLPCSLDSTKACVIACAGVTAWTALQGFGIGNSVLVQGMYRQIKKATWFKFYIHSLAGTGGVSNLALKPARLSGLKVILSSSSDEKFEKIRKQFASPTLLAVNYVTNFEWHEDVLKHTGGHGVDLVIEIGGAESLVKSMKCTKRGGTISQVGYLSKQNSNDLALLLPVLIDPRVVLQ
ncbi:hypothetical protein AWENTII_007168 [Aspergillus wentii]